MVRNVLLGAAAALLFFGLLETALRLSGRVPTQALRSPDLLTLDGIPGLFDPGQRFVDRILPDLPYRVTINSLGFRGAELERDKRPGSLRVLCVGDSYTFGAQVNDEEAFPAVLDSLLASAAPGASAINAGANGFTITDELAYLSIKGLGLDPDVVILVFTQNDLLDLRRPRPMIEVMRDHAGLKSTFLLGPMLKLLQRTAVFNGMQRAAAWLTVARGRSDTAPGRPGAEELWDSYRRHLERCAGLVADRGAHMLLVAWPSSDSVAGSLPFGYEELDRMARDMGLPYLDLAPTMKDLAASGEKPYLVPLDGHPSPEGHAAAARAIAARLAELGLLAAPAAPVHAMEAR